MNTTAIARRTTPTRFRAAVVAATALTFAGALALTGGTAAFAHDELVASSPENGQVLETFEVRFGSAVICGRCSRDGVVSPCAFGILRSARRSLASRAGFARARPARRLAVFSASRTLGEQPFLVRADDARSRQRREPRRWSCPWPW